MGKRPSPNNQLPSDSEEKHPDRNPPSPNNHPSSQSGEKHPDRNKCRYYIKALLKSFKTHRAKLEYFCQNSSETYTNFIDLLAPK